MTEYLNANEKKVVTALKSALDLFEQTEPLSKDEAGAFRQSIESALNLLNNRNIHRANEKQYPPAPKEQPSVGPAEIKAADEAQAEGTPPEDKTGG